LQVSESSCYVSGWGGVPKWLRERSAKPRCSGSNPLAASIFCLISFANRRADLIERVLRLSTKKKKEAENFGTKKHDSFLTVLHPEAAFQVSDRRLKPPALFGRKKIPEKFQKRSNFP
jgi:hypothetical protein